MFSHLFIVIKIIDYLENNFNKSNQNWMNLSTAGCFSCKLFILQWPVMCLHVFRASSEKFVCKTSTVEVITLMLRNKSLRSLMKILFCFPAFIFHYVFTAVRTAFAGMVEFHVIKRRIHLGFFQTVPNN